MNTTESKSSITLEAVLIKKDGTRIELGEIWNNENKNINNNTEEEQIYGSNR